MARKKVPPARLDGAEAWLPRVNRVAKPVAASPPKAPAPPVVTAAAGQHECTQCHAQVPLACLMGRAAPVSDCGSGRAQGLVHYSFPCPWCWGHGALVQACSVRTPRLPWGDAAHVGTVLMSALMLTRP